MSSVSAAKWEFYSRSIVAPLVLLNGACSSDGVPSPSGSGAQGGAGTSSPGGAGGATAQAGSGGAGVGAGAGGGSGGILGSGGAAGNAASSGGGTAAQGDAGAVAEAGRAAGGGGRAGTAGQSASAGESMGGAHAGGASAPGGAGGSAGSVAGGGGGLAGSAGADGAARSGGCGQKRTLESGNVALTFNGAARKYILRVPDGYDESHAHRLVLAYAWSGASASEVVSANYFTFAKLDPTDTIFVAPEASDGAGTWSNGDVAFTDAILEQIENDLCVDETRVFATGFSFGGAMAMALGCTRADVFRAVAFFSGADLTNSCPMTLTKPIAYYASQASEDSGGLSTSSPITGEKRQADFAAANGCTAEPGATTFPASGQPHTCTNYEGCSSGHPTEYCVFNGAHGWEPKDPGQATSWNAPEAWKFITQF